MPCPLPRWTETGASVGCYPIPLGPSPKCRRVGVHDFTFATCSDFPHVTACGIAQLPLAALVTRLRPGRVLDQQLVGCPPTSRVGSKQRRGSSRRSSDCI